LKNIFVGNLDFSVREEAIRALFETYGAVERVSIMTDRETGRSRGFAFVEMTNEGEAERAITALNGSDLSGRALNVNEARPKTDRGPRPGGGGRGMGGGGGFRDRDGGGGHARQRREPRW
jgi:cold-inducible RNA-binding protein